MILSRRERYIMIGTVVAASIFVLDRVVLSPLFERRQAINSQMSIKREQADRAEKLLFNRIRLNRSWHEISGTTLKADGSTAESQITRAVGDWANESRFSLSAIKPERAENDKKFNKITFRANGFGSMSAISRFIWHIQTSKIPIRITDITITTRKDGVDDLSLELGISTLFQPPEPVEGKATPTARLDRKPDREDQI
jgi:hypothetical protein